MASLGIAYGKAGRIVELKKLLDELRGLAQKTFVSPMCFAYIHFGLGDIDKAFDWLEKAVDEQDGLLYNIPALSSLQPLRSHPRYKALLRKMNLEP